MGAEFCRLALLRGTAVGAKADLCGEGMAAPGTLPAAAIGRLDAFSGLELGQFGALLLYRRLQLDDVLA